MRKKELFYYVTWGSYVTRDVHWCVTVDYQQIANGNIANQITGFTIDYGKFILKSNIERLSCIFLTHGYLENNISQYCVYSLLFRR